MQNPDGQLPSTDDWDRTIVEHDRRSRAFASTALILATLVFLRLFARELSGRRAAEMAYFVADRRGASDRVDTDLEDPR